MRPQPPADKSCPNRVILERYDLLGTVRELAAVFVGTPDKLCNGLNNMLFERGSTSNVASGVFEDHAVISHG